VRRTQNKTGSGQHQISRRRFLRGAGATLILPPIVSAAANRADGHVAPSNRVTVGIIGCGCMGRGHVRRMATSEDAQVLAVCDVDRLRVEEAKVTVDQSQGHEAAEGCTIYNDYRELLARDDVDAVVIVTPDHWHSPISIHAAQAGKDVYCEKPVSVTVAEGRQMVEAVQRYGRVFQNGSQYRTNPTIRRVCEFVRAGGLGEIKAVVTIWREDPSAVHLAAEPTPSGLDWDRWVGPAPWRP
jgi:predicted dehydrogenase